MWFNSPKMGPREMRQVVNIAHGIMVSEITNSTFRGTSKPSNLKYIDILNVIRAGGMFLKMEHCVVAWLLIRPTADTSQTEARLLGALKDLVQFDSDGATPHRHREHTRQGRTRTKQSRRIDNQE